MAAIIEAAVETDRVLTPFDVLAKLRLFGLSTPREAEPIVRADRDERNAASD